MKRLNRSLDLVLSVVLVPVLLISLWWFATARGGSPVFPPLSDIMTGFLDQWTFDAIQQDLLPSLVRFGIGFSIAVVLGVALGSMMGLSTRARRDISPVTEFLRATPMAALVPLAQLTFGATPGTEILLIAFAATWFVLIGAMDGVRGVDPLYREMARSYGLSRFQQIRVAVLPAALPQIGAGIRVALAVALGVMLIANMFGSTSGLGYFVVRAQARFDVVGMWAGLLMIGLLGLLVHLIYELVEHRVLRWHRGWRSTAKGTS
jgi:ABC-type nitrate/sulfonate/bicarbonate transport system permease component